MAQDPQLVSTLLPRLRVEQRAFITEYKAKSAECRGQGTDYRAQGADYRVQSTTEYRGNRFTYPSFVQDTEIGSESVFKHHLCSVAHDFGDLLAAPIPALLAAASCR